MGKPVRKIFSCGEFGRWEGHSVPRQPPGGGYRRREFFSDGTASEMVEDVV